MNDKEVIELLRYIALLRDEIKRLKKIIALQKTRSYANIKKKSVDA